jgi:hypothetical protein
MVQTWFDRLVNDKRWRKLTRRCQLILAVMGLMGIVPGIVRNASAQLPTSFRTIRGKHLTLKTDSGSPESLADLVESFDAAVPQWERFLALTPGTLDRWHVDGFVISDPARFRASGDLPADIDFPFGYAIPGNIWVMRQPSDYYTRHLLLHEGVHALTIDQFGGTGPAWFAEGLAEMLGVHRGTSGEVEVNVVPDSRQSTPYWGRFKLLSQRRAENRIPTMDLIWSYPNDLRSDVESYGWSWVAMMLLTHYPEYRSLVLEAARDGDDSTPAFTESFKRSFGSQLPIVNARWRMLAETIDYGFDWSREQIELSMKDKLWKGDTRQAMIQADRGWQSAGVRFAPGMNVKISATGRCTIKQHPKPWISEPPGVTIHYANDRPLGQLLVCVLPNQTDQQQQLAPLQIEPVEREIEIVVDQHCWLLFRINDDLGDLANNRGGYSITIQR